MPPNRSAETAAVWITTLVGALLFGWAIVQSDAIPTEYRSASPGFGWSWDFDYTTAVPDTGRPAVGTRPWPAQHTGDRLMLPLGQPLAWQGLQITYRGMASAGTFRLDVVIRDLGADTVYPQDVRVSEARNGFLLGDRQFFLEKITRDYLRLRLARRD
jgi:hypothetical protein